MDAKLRALLIDDEPLAHQVLLHHLQKHPDITVVAQCYDATQALAVLAEQSVDLLFLDVNMPALSGLALLKVLAHRPLVVLVSAHAEHALAGFDLDVVDYLLKPVAAERFAQALDKVRRQLVSQSHTPQAQAKPAQCAEQAATLAPLVNKLWVRVDREDRQLAIADIHYLEAFGNYVKIWLSPEHGQNATHPSATPHPRRETRRPRCETTRLCGEAQHPQSGLACWLTASTLKQFLERLPSAQFVQIHKSWVVNRQLIAGIAADHVRLHTGKRLKLGHAFKANVLAQS